MQSSPSDTDKAVRLLCFASIGHSIAIALVGVALIVHVLVHV